MPEICKGNMDEQTQYGGTTTTANSKEEGKLKVGVSTKRKILKKLINKSNAKS